MASLVYTTPWRCAYLLTDDNQVDRIDPGATFSSLTKFHDWPRGNTELPFCARAVDARRKASRARLPGRRILIKRWRREQPTRM